MKKKSLVSESHLKKIVKNLVIKESVDQEIKNLNTALSQELNAPEKMQELKTKTSLICKDCFKHLKDENNNDLYFVSPSCNFCSTPNKLTKETIYNCVMGSSNNIERDDNPSFISLRNFIECMKHYIGEKKYDRQFKKAHKDVVKSQTPKYYEDIQSDINSKY